MQTVRSNLKERTGILHRCSLFDRLSPRELEDVARMSIVRAYANDEYVFIQDEKAHGFYVVADGRLKVHRMGVDGREQILHMFGAGEMCGEVPVFEGEAYPASAAAVGPLHALYLPRREFLALGKRRPEILMEMLAVLSLRLRRFVHLIDDLSLKEVSARLAKYLLDLHAHGGSAMVELDSSKATLAARLGTIAETLSRTLRKMQQRKVIDVDGRRVTIMDRERLIELAAGERL